MTIKLFEGDKRLETLYEAIEAVVYERGKGLPIPAILGTLELVKQGIFEGLND